MANIYDTHKAAFARVSAYVVLREGKRVATVAFKYPADGAGRLYAYVHWIGTPMVRGFAAGGGYDKATAACAVAVANKGLRNYADHDGPLSAIKFVQALDADRGPTWDAALRDAGFTVLQAV